MAIDQLQNPFVYPPGWAELANDLVGDRTLNVAGYEVTVHITAEQLDRVYLPLLAILTDYRVGGRRVLAGLAGIPGSGKSTFAATVALLADRIWPSGRLAVVGMDGWHYPNAVLDTQTVLGEEGEPIPLRKRKGGPQSFDVSAMAAALKSLQPMHRFVNLPAYDRRLHDPVPDTIRIAAQTQIVFIEGNFLLSTQPPWDRVSSLLKPRFFLEANPAVAHERIIERHIRGGASLEQADEKFETNDLLNIDAARETAANADVIIRLDPNPQLRVQISLSGGSL